MARTIKPAGKAKAKVFVGTGQLRVIGGQWRSRRLTFPEAQGLRPTPDRVRETLYNWLAPYIEGARLLDPFVGSGALFLEGLSRGAASGLAFDLHPPAVTNVQQNLQVLGCTQAAVRLGNALQLLQQSPAQPFDIVLLDPPFHQNLLADACHLLEEQQWLTAAAWVYTESEQAPSQAGLPSHWRLHREKHTGQVYYALWQRQPIDGEQS